MTKLKVGIFDPYLDTISGGERYVATIAECLGKKNDVDIFWHDSRIKLELSKRLSLDLRNVKVLSKNADLFLSKGRLLRKWKLTKNYNAFFYLSDGGVPFSFAKKNILLLQNPFLQATFSSWCKIRLFQHVICNSYFTKKHIDKTYGINSSVIYPPVDVKQFLSLKGKKSNIILNVGRFVPDKKQDVLVKVFSEMHDSGLKNWKLVLVGNSLGEKNKYLTELKKLTKGYPIEIVVNSSFPELKQHYNKAKIYWHAKGFQEDLEKYPDKAEHFGISTVEAMAAGLVPVVFNAGGQREIVLDNIDGFLWETTQELKDKTLNLIADHKKTKHISLAAREKSKFFRTSNNFNTVFLQAQGRNGNKNKKE